MGFRNPITSATDVDTRDPVSGGGARLYNVPDPVSARPQGVLDFADGIAGDTPARVSGHADYNPRAEGATLGGGLKLSGGTYHPGGPALTAPEFDLNVEADGAGGFFSVARLIGNGGRVLTDTPWQTDPAWADVTVPAGTLTPWPGQGPQARRDGAGNAHWRGLVKLTGSLANATAVTLPLPAGFAPTVDAWRLSFMIDTNGAYLGTSWIVATSGGVLSLQNNTGAARTAGQAFAVYLSYPTT